MTTFYATIKSYSFPILLIASILLGGFTGYELGPKALYLKPLGEIFLNLIFTTMVPLIFFSISSTIAGSDAPGKLGKTMFYMAVVFLFTGVIAALYALVVVSFFPPAQGVYLQLVMPPPVTTPSLSSQLVNIFTVSEFSKLLSHKNILALIVFSVLVGIAAAHAKEKRIVLATFLHAGETLFMQVFSLIMYYAPIGFFAYFAVLVSELGPQLIESYARIACIYYFFTFFYFVVAFTGYAYLAGKSKGVSLFWSHVFLPCVTAIATCSSAASIPANLKATQKMQVSASIYETAIPIGSMIHKDGSVIGGIFKIAFLFGIFHLSFSGMSVLTTALGVALLVGTVMGAIPSGGMLGELLILTVYGFPPAALVAIAAISIIIDPLATMVNVTGNSVSSMIIARLMEGKKWFIPAKKIIPSKE